MLKLVLLSHRSRERAEHRLPAGLWTLGGAESDALCLPDLPPAALEVEAGLSGMIATAKRVGARAGLAALKPGDRRLIRLGESLSFGGHELRVEARLSRERPAPAPALVWLNGRDCGKRALLTAETTLIGRGERCAVRVRDARASRLHATLVLDGGEARATDAGSRNGLKINGVSVRGEQRLFGGEILTLGGTELAFEAASAPEDAPAAAPGTCAEWASATLEAPEAAALDSASSLRRRAASIAIAGIAALALAAWLGLERG